MTQRLSLLPDAVLALPGNVRRITEAIKRYGSPLPSESESDRSEEELRIADWRELRHRHRLRIGLSKIARRHFARAAGEPGTPPRSKENLQALAQRYLPQTSPPRGGRQFEPTRGQKRDMLMFAAELACLLRPAFKAAAAEFHEEAARLRRKNKDDVVSGSENLHEKQILLTAIDLAHQRFEQVSENEIGQWACEPTPDGGGLDNLVVVPSLERLRELINTIGLACLDWILAERDALRPPTDPIPKEVATALTSMHQSGEACGPLAVAAAFGASITGTGLRSVVVKAKAIGDLASARP